MGRVSLAGGRDGVAAGRVPALVGRGRELGAIGLLADAAAGGDGRIVVIGGEAGIGKSRLAAEALTACASRGFGVFAGAADEVERRCPFGVVADALGVRDGSVEAAGLSGRHVLADPLPGSEGRAAELLVAVVRELCRPGPAVIFLDDLQWADESSLAAVHRIAVAVSSLPVLLVCALRPVPTGRSLRALLADLDYRGAERIELAGLDAGAAVELAAVVAGVAPGDSVRRVLEDAAGNPFYVCELLRCLLREGGAKITERGLLELTEAGLPPSLGLTILEQLRFLPDETLGVLRAAAVVGRSFSLAEVAFISPSRVPDVVAALGPAQRAGVVTAAGERLSFRHDLIREAIYDDLAPAVRIGLHRHLASRLAESGGGLERVGSHAILGAEAGDVEAIGWLRQAATQVTATSPAIAVDLLWRALELSTSTALRVGVLGEVVCPLLWTGQAARAEQVCVEALDAGPAADDEGLFWVALVDSKILQGRLEQARETAGRALACPVLSESDRLHLTTSRALAGVYLGDPEGLEEARRVVATAPTSIPKAIAQEAIAQWELFTGRADRSLAAYEQVDSMREPARLQSRIWQRSGIRVRMWEGLALLDLDRLDDAAALLEREIAAKLSVPALPHAFLAACRYHAGELDEALRECRAAVASAEAATSFLPAQAPALAAIIALRQGRIEEAQRLADQAEAVLTAAEVGGDTITRWARVLVLEATGQLERAAGAAAGALDAYQRKGFASYLAWHAPDLVRVALLADRADQAEQAVHAAEHAASQLPVASRRAGALRARGLLAGDPVTLGQALAAAREAPRPLDLAATLRDTAAAFAASGEHDRGRPLATEALELLRGLGAHGDERSARKLLRDAGLKLSARARHTRASAGWDSLTEAELKVVELAAQGRSNPEIAQQLYVSRRTVAWHLSNVFGKLGVSSRGELAALVLRRDTG